MAWNDLIKYNQIWKTRGYPEDIPEEVPEVLFRLKRAPSYKAICITILNNDVSLRSLGMTPKASKVYSELKRIQIQERNRK